MRNKKGQFTKGYTYRKPKPYWDRNWLWEEYREKKKSAKQIAEEQGCEEMNIIYFLRKLNIPRWTMKEIRERKYWGVKGKQNGMYGKTGRLNSHWKGGITPERQALYSSLEWADVIKKVWKRDNYSCQRCGKRKISQEEYHIHHIISFKDKKLRLALNNLVLLCKDCHHFVHSKKNKNGEFLEGGDVQCPRNG